MIVELLIGSLLSANSARPWRGFLFQYRGFLAGSGGVASAMQLAMNASFSGCASAGLTSSDWTSLRSLFLFIAAFEEAVRHKLWGRWVRTRG